MDEAEARQTTDDVDKRLDIEAVQMLLPHRYPFLMVDRVLSGKPGHSIQAVKNVTINEPFFQGHFPGQAIMPGVLIIEALVQVSALLGYLTEGAERARTATEAIHLLVGVDRARFKRQVMPGDTLLLESLLLARRGNTWKFDTRASVEGQLSVQAGVLLTLSS